MFCILLIASVTVNFMDIRLDSMKEPLISLSVGGREYTMISCNVLGWILSIVKFASFLEGG